MAAIAGVVLWTEHVQRVELEQAPVAFADACPHKESNPESTECIAFIMGAIPPVPRPQLQPDKASTQKPVSSDAAGSPCPPNNENLPYSAECLKFLSGWYWQADPALNRH